jgi:hypothetical protein
MNAASEDEIEIPSSERQGARPKENHKCAKKITRAADSEFKVLAAKKNRNFVTVPNKLINMVQTFGKSSKNLRSKVTPSISPSA